MENDLLGAALIDVEARNVLATEVEVDEFYSTANRLVAEAIVTLRAEGHAIDAHIVIENLRGRALLDQAGGPHRIVGLAAETGHTRSASTYATIIRDRATRRRVQALGVELADTAADMAVEIDVTANNTRTALEQVALPLGASHVDNIEEFMAAGESSYEWAVPSLLEVGERLMIVAAEKTGKSTLMRQMALMLAAGIHPFSTYQINPVRTLVIDLENRPTQARRKFAPMLRNVVGVGQQALDLRVREPWDPDKMRIEVRPSGMDLLSRNDRRWFEELIIDAQPDVVLTGPVYKMYHGNQNDEELAAKFGEVIDDLKERYKFAIVLEAHTPLAASGRERELRPIGTSYWQRWIDFGFAMRLSDQPEWAGAVSWEPFIPPRDEGRAWPVMLRRGKSWPWMPAGGAEDGFTEEHF